jgi:cytochrome bd-type quinol oxidase subunit 2
MWWITILFGVALGAVGGYGYAASESHSPTALIPAAFGAVLLICGALAASDKMRKHAMHAAAMVGLLGLIGGAVMAVPKLPKLLSEGKVTRADGSDATLAVEMQSLMAVLCLVFVGLCVNSFVQARLLRRKVGQPDPHAQPVTAENQ